MDVSNSVPFNSQIINIMETCWQHSLPERICGHNVFCGKSKRTQDDCQQIAQDYSVYTPLSSMAAEGWQWLASLAQAGNHPRHHYVDDNNNNNVMLSLTWIHFNSNLFMDPFTIAKKTEKKLGRPIIGLVLVMEDKVKKSCREISSLPPLSLLLGFRDNF